MDQTSRQEVREESGRWDNKKVDVNNPQTMRNNGQGSLLSGCNFRQALGRGSEGKSGMSIRALGGRLWSSLGCTEQTLAGWFELLRLGNASKNPSELLLGWLVVLSWVRVV